MINQTIEERVEKLLNDINGLKAPINPFYCAKALSIEVNDVELEDNVSGFLILNNGLAKLGYNKAHSHRRQRFTVAHEIGHFVLHAMDAPLFIDKTKVQYAKYDRNQNSSTGELIKEREANSFAAALLMPSKLVDEYFNNSINKEKPISLIRELSQIFEVSEQAMGIRLSQLGYLDYDNAY